MVNQKSKNELFHVYYKQWITVYKEGAISKVTMAKYLMTHQWLEKLATNLSVSKINRLTYQQLLNDYAVEHERQTAIQPAKPSLKVKRHGKKDQSILINLSCKLCLII